MSRLRGLSLALLREMEGAVREADHIRAGRPGQHVPFHGDFASVVLMPSAIEKMREWSKAFRDAIAEEQKTCTHGVVFDQEAAKGLPSNEVRKRWPRGFFNREKPCPECGYGEECEGGAIAYASYAHYIYGDW